MKTRIFNLIILDESGSMYSIMNEAINGVNETIQSIREAMKKDENQEHFVSLVTFNDSAKTIYDNLPVKEVSELTEDQYRPNCCTALFDAMGMSLNKLKKCVADNDRVLVTIVTDGMENNSKEYNGPTIKKLVEELKSKGWIFAYIGANQDVEKVAANISINNYMSFETTSEGTTEAWNKQRRGRARLYARMAEPCFDSNAENCSFFDEENIAEDEEDKK